MAELNLNHIGQALITVTGTPVGITIPQALTSTGAPATDALGRPLVLNPKHALLYIGAQPVRWRADGIAPEGAPGMGMYLAAGSYLSWLDPLGDFSALIDRALFVRAEGSTGNALIDISFFA